MSNESELEYYKGRLSIVQQHYEDTLQRLHKFKRALEDIRDKQVLDSQGVVDLDNLLTAAMRNIAIEALE